MVFNKTMNRFHTLMANSPYFSILLPYVQHLNAEKIQRLPADYFRQHKSELHVAFQLFHERYIAGGEEKKSSTADESGFTTLTERLRKQNYHEVLDELRRNVSRPTTL